MRDSFDCLSTTSIYYTSIHEGEVFYKLLQKLIPIQTTLYLRMLLLQSFCQVFADEFNCEASKASYGSSLRIFGFHTP